MLFNSIRFIFFFLPLILAVSMRLKGKALLRFLTLASFFFYAYAGRSWFLIPMLVTTVLDFLVAPKIAAASSRPGRRAWLGLSLCGNLGLLFWFKYANLFSPGLGVILPAGISFYTFQTLSYVIDVYRGDCPAERNFWKFAGFVSFFPHLVAGPLTRHHQLIPPLTRISEEGVRPHWEAGLMLFSIGLCKKVLIADRIAAFSDPIIDSIATAGPAQAWLALLGYSLQIYFDFSGYSDMAIGLGRLFGIELPQNFNSPYQALDPIDFWRRWHMTLSSWLRDYLYIPLGGNRLGEGRRRVNLIITMVLGGLWHGANWTFAAWGLYHGLLLTLTHRWQEPWSSLPPALRRAGTFTAVTLGWVLFRSPDFGHAALWFSRLFGYSESAGGPPAPLLALCAAALLAVLFAPNASSFRRWDELPLAARAALGAALGFGIIMMDGTSRFLYFQF